MLNSVKKLQIFYAKSPEISLATSPAEQAVHGVLFTFNLRTFGYRLQHSVAKCTVFAQNASEFTDFWEKDSSKMSKLKEIR